MTPKQKRDRLFRKSRPFIRRYKEEDAGFMWAAYTKGGFGLPSGLSQEQFAVALKEVMTAYEDSLVIEDANAGFKSGRGPIGFVGIKSNGWMVEPFVDFYPWATARNVLRANVAFFQMIRYSKIVMCVVKSLAPTNNLFDRMKSYAVLFPIGRTDKETLYSIRGKLGIDGGRA
jgi:hypothetical protein